MTNRTYQLLLALAWLGEATKAQLRDLCCPGMSEKTVQRALAPVMGGPTPLVIARPRHLHDGTAPKREAFVYALSEAGHKHLFNDPAYPRKTQHGQYPAKLTSPADLRRLEHQLQATEAIVRLIVLARQRSLSGVFVAHEMRLNRQRPEPVMDAVVILHIGGEAPGDGAVPWTKDAPVAGERVWCLAIESDRATEAPAVIAAKASAYAAAEADQRTREDWRERTGHMLPTVLWVAPTTRRVEAIQRVWREQWSAGSWMLATPQQLAAGNVWHYRNREQVELRLFAGTSSKHLGARVASTVTPAAPPSPPVQLSDVPIAAAESSRTTSSSPSPATDSKDIPPPRPAPAQPERKTEAPLPLPPPTTPTRTRSRSEWAAFVVERALLWPFFAVMIAIGWTAEQIGRGLWWLLRLFGRGMAAVWSWLDDASGGAALNWLVFAGATAAIVGVLWLALGGPLPSLGAFPRTASTATSVPPPVVVLVPTAPVRPTPVPPTNCGSLRVAAPAVNLRKAPGTANTSIGKLTKGTLLIDRCARQAAADGLEWAQVQTQGGQEGWVRSDLVEASSTL